MRTRTAPHRTFCTPSRCARRRRRCSCSAPRSTRWACSTRRMARTSSPRCSTSSRGAADAGAREPRRPGRGQAPAGGGEADPRAPREEWTDDGRARAEHARRRVLPAAVRLEDGDRAGRAVARRARALREAPRRHARGAAERDPLTPVEPGRIVVLNGAPRSGKSSIVAAIQETFDGVWMNLRVDVFAREVTPPRYRPGIGLRPGGDRPDLRPLVPTLYAAMYASVAAHSRAGLNVVVDVGHYDREVDTSVLDPGACAAMIAARLREGPRGTAFERLASPAAP